MAEEAGEAVPDPGPEWGEAGFDPFEAALAHADGFTAAMAVHYRSGLRRVAEGWRAAGLADAEGLRWHMAGFSSGAARHWRDRGKTLDEVRPRAGYGTVGLGRKS